MELTGFLIDLALMLGLLIALDLAALRWGYDSRVDPREGGRPSVGEWLLDHRTR